MIFAEEEGLMEAVVAGSGTLLGSISDFCRRTGMAESTFGRRAVNDGKFVSRLRDGARVTPETLQRVNVFIQKHGVQGPGDSPPELLPLIRASARRRCRAPRVDTSPEKNFRFFDNRQKYLLFVNTCSEKDVVARRVGLELGHIHPQPPAVRLFDAGMGDGTVLAQRDARDAPALLRPCRSTSSARRSASRTCACRCARWPTACSSTRRPCWSSPTCTTPRRRG